MDERIKQIRKQLNLTQAEFGKRIGIKQPTIAAYEKSVCEPSKSVIVAICLEYNINETWLRTGNGTMFNEQASRKDAIKKRLNNPYMNEDTKDRLATAISKLSEDQLELVIKIISELVNNQNK